MDEKTQKVLAATNTKLKDAKTKVSLKVRGDMLYMQATLPPKTDSPRTALYQQEIASSLAASADGLRRAEKEAKKLGSLLALKEFDWSLYIQDKPQLVEIKTVGDWVTAFKTHYMQTHSLSEHTWRNEQHKIFKLLPVKEPLTAAMLQARVEATPRNTRHRRVTVTCLQALADYANVVVDLKPYRGKYGTKPQDRDIPTDAQIVEARSRITNDAWRWLYGVLAAYGLRPHEAWFCEFMPGTHELLVTRGKTGARNVFTALYPEWVEAWNLTTIQLPNIDGIAKYHKLGSKVARGFKTYSVGFPPYALRHAYAIRASLVFGLPVTTSAALMGHSPTMHLQTYQRHGSIVQNREITRRLLAGDHPKPSLE